MASIYPLIGATLGRRSLGSSIQLDLIKFIRSIGTFHLRLRISLRVI